MISTFSSFGVYACLRHQNMDALNWLGAGIGMLLPFPVTFILIQPINVQLLETEACIKEKSMYILIDPGLS